MSTSRDGGTRGGRGRGTTFASGAPRSRGRGRGDFTGSPGRGGSNANRTPSGGPFRGNGPPSTRGRGRGQPSAVTATGRAARGLRVAPTTGSWQERQEKLKAHREQERKDAIAQGLMTDPDKAVALADAITLVGTCQGMCSEYEMVLRVNRNEVFPEEKVNGDPNGEPDESRFVKTFKRSEAGAEAQLPSDLRPPASLKRTCDYLFNEIVGNAATLGKVHHFVWDRTRAIRNDFSIQQLTKLDDLRIAIECYERIARFHIVSLHQLALARKPYDKYDSQQEREQLDRTLLSLMQYYDDTRGRLENTNEAEFRAYCVIFAITNPVPDLEDRVQTWPRHITKDMRVQTALEVYAAACQTTYGQGPMPPKAKPVIAQQDWQKFWNLVQSRKMSYLAACVCEIFFNYIREIALKSLIRSLRASRRASDGTFPINSELSLDHVAEALQYDDLDDLYSFVARWGLEFQPAGDENMYLDIRNIAGTVLPEPKAGATQQKSFLVENKRFGRTLPAVIDGLTVRQAADKGMIVEEEHEEEMDDAEKLEEEEAEDGDEEIEDEGNGLFVGLSKHEQEQSQQSSFNHETLDRMSPSNAPSAGFGAPSTAFGAPRFGVQSTTVNGASNPFASSGFGQPSNAFNASKPTEASPKTDGAKATLKSAFGGGDNPFGKPAVASNPWASPFGAPTTGAPTANLFAPSTTLGLAAKSDAAEPQASPFAPSTTLNLSADNKDAAALKSRFHAGTAFGAPSTTAPLVASAPEPAKPQSPRLVKKGPFEEDSSPTNSTKKQDFFSQAEEASKLQTTDVPAAPSLSARSETKLKAAPAQQSPPQTAAASSTSSQPPTASQPPPPQPPPPPGAQSPTKRRSSGWEDNKPKRPSPLQNSHTPTADSTTRATQQTDIHSVRDSPAAPAIPLPPPEKTTDELLTEIAQIVTFDPTWGIWKQFVDFQVGQIIAKTQKRVQDEIWLERYNALLFRRRATRLLHALRELVRRRRVSAEAKVRRERTRRRLRESILSNGSSAATMGNSTSSFGASGPTSQSQANGVNRGHVDALLQSLARGRQSHLQGRTQAGSKRSASAYGSDVAASTNPPMHKRQKSMSHVDDQGKITKPTPPSDPNDDILKRSSFLGFSSRDAQQRANTTKSTYFRMKALGLQGRPGGVDPTAFRGTKRLRSESLDAISMPPPARPNAPTVAASSPEAPSVASARSVRSKADEEDEALFARLKAAREALRDSEKSMREEVAKEELRRSMNDSQSSHESPSLARARAEARLRASRRNSESRERDVPAYRLRESRFVPREEYQLAEERARQMRASRANSRAGSRESSRPPEVAKGVADTDTVNEKTTASMLFDSPSKPVRSSKQSSGFGAPAQTAMAPSWGFGAPTQAPAVQPAVPDFSARNPFSQSSSFAPPSNGQNPFLQTFGATNATSFDDIPKDNTLALSQINGTLARSLGQPSQGAPSAFARAGQNSPTPPQTNSYMPSQAASEAISLLSDDGEETQQSHQEQQSGEISYGQQASLNANMDNDINAAFAERSATVSFDHQVAASQALLQGDYDYTNNPFAALADGISDDEQFEEVDNDQQSEEAFEDDDQRDTAPQPDSYQYSDDQEGDYEGEGTPVDEYSDDDVAPNGYIDSEAEEDGDIEDEDGDLGEERPHDWDSEADGHWEFGDEDDDEEGEPSGFAPLNHAYNTRVMQTAPKKDPALQMVGHTEEEAIELSD